FNNPTIFTISTWFKTTTNNGGKLIGFGNQQVGQSQNYDRNLWLDPSGHVHFGIYSNGDERTIGTTSTFNDGQWHQACAQLSPSGMKLFVDGTLRATNNSYTIPENFTGYWRIGYDNMTGWPDAPNSFYILGALDEATVSNAVRSESWVKLNYENQKNGSSLLSLNNGKPVVSLNQLVEALPESSLTAQAFSIAAALGTSKSSSTSIQVKLNYFGNAQNGIDYDPLQSSYSLTIPADSTLASQVINLTPIEDLLDEGNETLYVAIVPDTAYRVGNEDTIAIVITDNDQKYPPVILKEPADTSALTGDVASFSVEVSGSTPLTYQWTMNGIPVGTSSSTLITPPVSMNDSGAHIQCIITNSVGADTTRVATLYVSVRPEAPVIVRQPQTVTVAEGEYATFSVAVAGTPPFTYQWYNDSALVSGAVDSSIRVGPVTKNDNNSRYYCRVSNSVTDMISWKAILTVRKPSSQILVITGELYTSDLHAIGSSSTATMDFTVKLFPSMTSDSLLYSESFLTQYNQAIKVTDGKFSIRLGEGNATGDLVDIVRSNSNIFVSFSISRPGGNPETLNRRVPLTASPYALSSLPQIYSRLI
ncbi:MAG: hypothetical protein GX640_05990, partial [Fibrobacter sp.]|nr:hypothetical protein [Fibrobacter sp.]